MNRIELLLFRFFFLAFFFFFSFLFIKGERGDGRGRQLPPRGHVWATNLGPKVDNPVSLIFFHRHTLGLLTADFGSLWLTYTTRLILVMKNPLPLLLDSNCHLPVATVLFFLCHINWNKKRQVVHRQRQIVSMALVSTPFSEQRGTGIVKRSAMMTLQEDFLLWSWLGSARRIWWNIEASRPKYVWPFYLDTIILFIKDFILKEMTTIV
ncbi:hypothetical protein DM01DRAFT_1026592 [Hesseltinella vesiculosa]|uniref:Uncharacterized protein n=1 Tax=Hesseltinella vesiculosa TaxID=101127 RepID=A0A1X2GK89_9FUNG|nr:hypothetical protein DM01DRAFT_1026592 [Hesseltinella vesiculosa]